MNMLKKSVLIVFFMLIAASVYSGDYAGSKVPPATPSVKAESGKKSSPAASKDTADIKDETGAGQKTQTQDQIKAKSICIGEDCRGKWPAFKCANYDKRPARETGDEFCGRMNKTCVAVFIGNGQTFFDECSVAANSVHKCRCCWVE